MPKILTRLWSKENKSQHGFGPEKKSASEKKRRDVKKKRGEGTQKGIVDKPNSPCLEGVYKNQNACVHSRAQCWIN